MTDLGGYVGLHAVLLLFFFFLCGLVVVWKGENLASVLRTIRMCAE
jgi:hypothetical protein